MIKKINNWLKNSQFWFLPPVCVVCGRPGESEQDLCVSCKSELPFITGSCLQCAIPLHNNGICGQCLQSQPAFDVTHVLFHYAEPVDYLIQRLKFNGKLYNARLFATLMVERASQQDWQKPDAIVPVPLHSTRLRQRGFNQALEIARLVSTNLAIPLRPTLCHRKRATSTQTGLDAAARRQNLKHAFSTDKTDKLDQYRHLVILDDVMTTGSTVNLMAKVLKQAGVERVDVWAVARASLENA